MFLKLVLQGNYLNIILQGNCCHKAKGLFKYNSPGYLFKNIILQGNYLKI